METRFDGAAGDVEVFANGQAIVRDVGQAKYRFMVQTFRIGYIRFNTAREVRFDDVVLSPNRVGCD